MRGVTVHRFTGVVGVFVSLAGVAVLAGCGGDDGPPMRATTSFTATDIAGAGTSPLDSLLGQTLDIELVWTHYDFNHGDGSGPAGCKTTAVGSANVTRTAKGATASVVQSAILDPLPDWFVVFELCEAGSGQSSIALESAINELNLELGCFGVPENAKLKDADGNPLVSSFTAMQCSATILDVVNNRVLTNPNFSIVIETGPSHLP